MERFPALVTAALLMTTISAAADWEYTRWGMSESEVVAAAKGKLVSCRVNPTLCPKPNADGIPLLFGDYRSDGFDFTIRAWFNNDSSSAKLGHVGLVLKRPELGEKLVAAYQAKYGKPLSQRPDEVFEVWIWHTKTDNISLALVRTGPKRYAGVIIGPISPAKAPAPSRAPAKPRAPSSQRE